MSKRFTRCIQIVSSLMILTAAGCGNGNQKSAGTSSSSSSSSGIAKPVNIKLPSPSLSANVLPTDTQADVVFLPKLVTCAAIKR